jgi:hypothetical protein
MAILDGSSSSESLRHPTHRERLRHVGRALGSPYPAPLLTSALAPNFSRGASVGITPVPDSLRSGRVRLDLVLTEVRRQNDDRVIAHGLLWRWAQASTLRRKFRKPSVRNTTLKATMAG